MRVDHRESGVLSAQMQKNRDKSQMLCDIGEIPGMKGVAIVHLFAEDPHLRLVMVDVDLQVAKLLDNIFKALRRQLADVDVDAFLAQRLVHLGRERAGG